MTIHDKIERIAREAGIDLEATPDFWGWTLLQFARAIEAHRPQCTPSKLVIGDGFAMFEPCAACGVIHRPRGAIVAVVRSERPPGGMPA